MPAKIKADVLQALDDWKAGKPVKSIELGHTHRMKDNGGASPTIDLSVRLSNDQERAHAYCFAILGFVVQNAGHMVSSTEMSHEGFMANCDMIELEFRRELHRRSGFHGDENLTAEERDAAESLAWKALHVGWNRAIAGHDASRYVEVTNPAVVAAT